MEDGVMGETKRGRNGGDQEKEKIREGEMEGKRGDRQKRKSSGRGKCKLIIIAHSLFLSKLSA